MDDRSSTGCLLEQLDKLACGIDIAVTGGEYSESMFGILWNERMTLLCKQNVPTSG
jgi:hypothetical protein